MTPRGLPRSLAADYIGCSPSKFDLMVEEGLMPKPRRLGNKTGVKRVWDRREIDECFDNLPQDEDKNEWDEDEEA